MLTLNEIRITLEKYLMEVVGNSAKLLPSKQAFIPTRASVYYQYKIEYSKTVQEEKGQDGLKRRNGALRVNIYSPSSVTVDVDNDLAWKVENFFSFSILKPSNPIVSECKIYCDTAYTLDVGADSASNKYVFSVVVPFFCWA